MDIGYRLTDLVYTGDLISSIGDSLTSVLDKIKTMLGDFEYFYAKILTLTVSPSFRTLSLLNKIFPSTSSGAL